MTKREKLEKVNREVSKEIFGETCSCVDSEQLCACYVCNEHQPPYSTDWTTAHGIIEKLDLLWFEVGRESVCGVRYDAECHDNPDMKDRVHVMEDTGPLAICKAALEYVREREERRSKMT